MLLLKLFLTFFKIGAFTFGGGYAMLPLVQSEVIKAGWMSEAELIDFIAVSESTPGPFAVNVSTYVGMETAGIMGAAAATLGVVLPSFIIILLLAGCYEKFKENAGVKGVMSGLKPAVVGLILAAVVSVGRTVFFGGGYVVSDYVKFVASAAIFIVMLYLILKKKHPIMIVCLSAVLGIAVGYIFNLTM